MNIYLDADRDIESGRMTLRPQNVPDYESAQLLVPLDKRVPLVGYWREGKLIIERSDKSDASDNPERAALMQMDDAAFETLCAERGVKFSTKVSREALVDRVLKATST